MRRPWKIVCMAVLLLLAGIVAGLVGGCRNGDIAITTNHQKRHYRLHIPANRNPETPAPLLFVLHPFMDTARGIEKITDFNRLADQEGFVAVYPQGRWRIWHDQGKKEAEDIAFLNTLLDHLIDTCNIDKNRIYGTGASAGAMLIQHFALRTDRLAAIAPVMGSLDRTFAASFPSGSPIAVLAVHGAADPVVPYAGGPTFAGPGRRIDFLSARDNAAFWAKQNGGEGEAMDEALTDEDPSDAFHTVKTTWPAPDGREVLLYTIHGGGHTWPGHENWYPAWVVGPTAPAPDATRLIWDFLKTHRRGE